MVELGWDGMSSGTKRFPVLISNNMPAEVIPDTMTWLVNQESITTSIAVRARSPHVKLIDWMVSDSRLSLTTNSIVGPDIKYDLTYTPSSTYIPEAVLIDWHFAYEQIAFTVTSTINFDTQAQISPSVILFGHVNKAGIKKRSVQISNIQTKNVNLPRKLVAINSNPKFKATLILNRALASDILDATFEIELLQMTPIENEQVMFKIDDNLVVLQVGLMVPSNGD